MDGCGRDRWRRRSVERRRAAGPMPGRDRQPAPEGAAPPVARRRRCPVAVPGGRPCSGPAGPQALRARGPPRRDNPVRRLSRARAAAWDRPLTAYYLILGGSLLITVLGLVMVYSASQIKALQLSLPGVLLLPQAVPRRRRSAACCCWSPRGCR